MSGQLEIVHNGSMYLVDPECLKRYCSKATTILGTNKRPTVRDKVSEKVFLCFLDLCHNREVSIVPGDVPQLVELVNQWGAEKAILELENRIIESQNAAAILGFYRSAPAVFTRLGSIIGDNFGNFSRYPEMADIPSQWLEKLLYPETRSPVATAIRERFRGIKPRIRPDMRKQQEFQEESLHKDIENLKTRIQTVRRKTQAIEARVSHCYDAKVIDEKVERKLDEIEDILMKMKTEVLEVNGLERATAQFEERAQECQRQRNEMLAEIEKLKTHT